MVFPACDVTRHMTELQVVIHDGVLYLVRGSCALVSERSLHVVSPVSLFSAQSFVSEVKFK